MLPKAIISLIIISFSCFLIFATYSSSTLEVSYFIKKADKSSQVLGVTEDNETEEAIIENRPADAAKISRPYSKENAAFLDLLSERAMVMDYETEAVLFEKDSGAQVPIASITKLSTALTFLDFNPGWDEVYAIKPADIASGGRIYLSAGDQISIRDLFNLSLVCSSNTGARALASATGLSEGEFVAAMNKRAAEMKLDNINFVEPTGLHSHNTASAHDLAIFAKHAMSNQDIRKATLQPKYSFHTMTGRKIIVHNTDSLLSAFPINGIEIQGGKTGFINLSGYCFVGYFKNHDEKHLISVILGSPDRNTSFQETKKIVNWAYNTYLWE